MYFTVAALFELYIARIFVRLAIREIVKLTRLNVFSEQAVGFCQIHFEYIRIRFSKVLSEVVLDLADGAESLVSNSVICFFTEFIGICHSRAALVDLNAAAIMDKGYLVEFFDKPLYCSFRVEFCPRHRVVYHRLAVLSEKYSSAHDTAYEHKASRHSRKAVPLRALVALNAAYLIAHFVFPETFIQLILTRFFHPLFFLHRQYRHLGKKLYFAIVCIFEYIKFTILFHSAPSL